MPNKAHQEGVEKCLKLLEEKGLDAKTNYTFTFIRNNGDTCTFTPDAVGLKDGQPFLAYEVGSTQANKVTMLSYLIPVMHWPYRLLSTSGYEHILTEEPHPAGGCYDCCTPGKEEIQVYCNNSLKKALKSLFPH